MSTSHSPMHVDKVAYDSLEYRYPDLMEKWEKLSHHVHSHEAWNVIKDPNELREVDSAHSSYNHPKEEFVQTVKDIAERFKEETGAELLLGYHDQELNGDRADSVTGWFWHVVNIRELNEAGEEVEDKFDLKRNRGYVVFG